MSDKNFDDQYQPFPQFADWQKTVISLPEWDEYLTGQAELIETGEEKLIRALKLVSRAAAVETGAIESLYETDRGFTMTVASELATWEAALDDKGEETKNLIKGQLEAYNTVLDFATEKRPIAEAWIRELHIHLCESQKTYMVQTSTGPQKQEFHHGEYKTNPNHVKQKDGSIHAYAPVDMTAPEMERLVNELRSKSFEESHPILQAAYSHYAFVCIHPFPDGNGRVARALASVYTYRAARFPILITSEKKREYFNALTQADAGNFQAFITFIQQRVRDAIEIVLVSIEAASQPDISAVVSQINEFYETEGGYTFDEIDLGGFELVREFERMIKSRFSEIDTKNISPNWSFRTETRAPSDPGLRLPVNPKAQPMFCVKLSTPTPANAIAEIQIGVEVPIQGATRERVKLTSILAQNKPAIGEFYAELEDLIPGIGTSVQMRMTIFVEQQLSLLLQRLSDGGNQALKNRGYRK